MKDSQPRLPKGMGGYKSFRDTEPAPTIAPLESWPAITNPTDYIEGQSGRYLAMYEGVMSRMMEDGNVELGAAMLLNLMRMTKVGRTKADVAVKQIGEVDLSHLKDEELLKLVSKELPE